jgi:hypothetical protein
MLTGEAVMTEDQEGRVAPIGDGGGSAVLTGDGGDGVASETDLRRWCWSDWRWWGRYRSGRTCRGGSGYGWRWRSGLGGTDSLRREGVRWGEEKKTSRVGQEGATFYIEVFDQWEKGIWVSQIADMAASPSVNIKHSVTARFTKCRTSSTRRTTRIFLFLLNSYLLLKNLSFVIIFNCWIAPINLQVYVKFTNNAHLILIQILIRYFM